MKTTPKPTICHDGDHISMALRRGARLVPHHHGPDGEWVHHLRFAKCAPCEQGAPVWATAASGYFHHASRCQPPCPLHAPTGHHMANWRLDYRSDQGIFERRCKHGIGHPDPDSLTRQRRLGIDDPGVHSCDGCCREESDHA